MEDNNNSTKTQVIKLGGKTARDTCNEKVNLRIMHLSLSKKTNNAFVSIYDCKLVKNSVTPFSKNIFRRSNNNRDKVTENDINN